ncbi:hypothetical protein [Subtercola lobariae]|uniref:Dicarboxylate transporter/tellurite-resistance protein TehA n=1 Tax=Subtercola lobariae TaxID=1588641 RepID=A0A917EYQ6_9MICO|nr:hypothetical protein [Subtercola lobariae]GGF31552.1 dicarboxylate transporter/tellurite-resistance protein TehA [Subtercola lobariae]
MTASTDVARIPLNTLAIPLGVAGLAELFSHSIDSLALPEFIAEIVWVVAGVVWVWMIAAHLSRAARSSATLRSQLEHPAQGPIASLVPIVGMLLGANLSGFWMLGGTILVIASLTVTALYAGWILASWMGGRLQLESVHGGYFLPTVAGGFVASYAAATIGAIPLALGAFVVAAFFWLVFFTVIFARLAFRPSLPDPLVPTLAIMMAPPAVAAAAWFAINGGVADGVEDALAALAVIMVLIQLALLPKYLRLTFSLGFWSFTFPTANVAALAVAWLHFQRPLGWQLITVALLVGVTALVVAIALGSRRIWASGRTHVENPAETQLTRADDAIAPVAHANSSRFEHSI